jgi:hypothetical protein
MLHNTFLASSEVFKQVPGDAQTVASVIHKNLPKTIRRLIKKTKNLFVPAAFILPKQKKKIKNGRPVIRFHRSPYQIIFRAAARVFTQHNRGHPQGQNIRTIYSVTRNEQNEMFQGPDTVDYQSRLDFVSPVFHRTACFKDAITQYCEKKHNWNLSTWFRAEGAKKYAASTKTTLKQFRLSVTSTCDKSWT